ncbi:MBL fold metallo-hydrolase [bacterium]|nr:MBL fold metallo-hydrolase [bacterium]
MEYHIINDGWIKIPADDFPVKSVGIKSDRLFLGLNQLFIRLAGKNVLIDTGLGNKRDYTKLGLMDYQLPRMLIQQLNKLDVKPENIDIVALTHLHYDHSGGCTHRLEDGSLAKTFTNALYYVQEKELEIALDQNYEHSIDYDRDDVRLLIDSGQLITVNGDQEIIPGLSVYHTPGHCPGHQIVIATENKETVFFPGDLIPVKEHANLSETTKYDYDKDELIKHRSKWLDLAKKNMWECVFCHGVNSTIDVLR